jgi:hypothetical protein
MILSDVAAAVGRTPRPCGICRTADGVYRYGRSLPGEAVDAMVELTAVECAQTELICIEPILTPRPPPESPIRDCSNRSARICQP